MELHFFAWWNGGERGKLSAMENLWNEVSIGVESYFLMNLGHKNVDVRVMREMEAGVEVFYDRRWEVTETLTDWLVRHPEVIRGKNILILGAGVGAETVVLGRHGKHVWINDLAPTALELCEEQMSKNGLENYTSLVGRYEELDLPEVDLVVASFLIYNEETLKAMRSFLADHQGEVILVNERLSPFQKFLKKQEHTVLFEDGGIAGVRLS